MTGVDQSKTDAKGGKRAARGLRRGIDACFRDARHSRRQEFAACGKAEWSRVAANEGGERLLSMYRLAAPVT